MRSEEMAAKNAENNQGKVVVVKKQLSEKEIARKKKTQKRIIIGAVVAALLAVIILPRLFAPPILPSVTVTAPRTGSVKETLDTSGTLKSGNEKTYFSPVNAPIKTSNVVLGQGVKKGDQLVAFDTSDLENANKQAELQSAASYYGYQDSVSKGNENAGKYNSSSSQVNSLQAQIDNKQQEIYNIQAAIMAEAEEKQQNAADAAADAAYQLQLLSEESVNLTKILNLITAIVQIEQTSEPEAADEQTEALRNELAAYGGQWSDPTSYQYNITWIQNRQAQIAAEQSSLSSGTGTITGSITSSYDIELQQAQNDLQSLQADLAEQQQIKGSSEAGILSGNQREQLAANNNLTELQAASAEELVEKGREGLKAEFDGIVSKSLVVEGGMATQGLELFTISSSEDVYVEVSVSKYDFEKLELGQKAEITVAGKTYDGEVESINRIATANEKGVPVIGTKVKINNPDEDIYLGVEAKVSILTAEANDVLLVPSEVVNISKEGTFCYVVEDDVIVKKTVETGVSSNDFIEIKSGIDKGATIVTTVTEDVVEGVKVKTREESTTATDADVSEPAQS
jgi:HlyD family secretion protein